MLTTHITAIQLSKEQKSQLLKHHNFTRFSPNVCFSITGSHSGFWILFSCVSLVSSNLWQFYIFPCLSWAWLCWWILASIFCKKSLNFGLSGILSWLYGGYEFQSKNTNAVTLKLSYLFSVHHHRSCHVNIPYYWWCEPAHFVKEMSASLLKLLFISFVPDQNLEEILWDYTNIFCFSSNIHSKDLVSVGG